MQVVLIGAGNLATNLGLALRDAGHEIVSVFSRTMTSAQRLAALTGGEATDDVDTLPKKADMFIVAVKDAVLASLIAQVAKGREGELFVHTAGSMPMSLFEGRAVRYGVFYPMQTFSKEHRASFSEIPIFLEASDYAVLGVLRLLADSISNRVFELDSSKRKFLHLAAVFACNFANHCYALSAEVLESQGIPFDVMLPLIDETARKVHALHPLRAQTGPAVRYDKNVIKMQADLLSANPEVQELYEMLSRSIHNLSNENSKIN